MSAQLWKVETGKDVSTLQQELNELEGNLYRLTLIQIFDNGSWVIVGRKQD